MLTIEMPRGDIRDVRFRVNNGQETEFDNIYFTVKGTARDKACLFQKKLSDGSISLDNEGYFNLRIEAQDTNDLSYTTYDFDIELVRGTNIKQTTVGQLIITKEVTFQSNEV